ncbi:hypothetical protein [Bosea sp. (in: a-proteobacteria)]|uniref:hypothetical protein n=1 Tax=Bosea sp. (in: a-proteobacteria) TaxID=1871050 RepID=UPI003B3B0CA2
MNSTISATQRYRNAVTKARILRQRALRDFQLGKIQMIAVAHCEREAIIAAIESAYRDGFEDGARGGC